MTFHVSCQDLNLFYDFHCVALTRNFKSDGLGSFYGVSNTLELGCRKQIFSHRFYFVLVAFFFTMFQSNYNLSCMSVILALQRSNETYKQIKYPYTHIQAACTSDNISLCRYLILSVSTLAAFTWVSLLIKLCGDVELNPGPDSVGGIANLIHDHSFEILANHLSILHLNIQSLVPKLDLVVGESEAYDVLVFSESWLKPEIKNDAISIENFQPPFRTDRPDRPGEIGRAHV